MLSAYTLAYLAQQPIAIILPAELRIILRRALQNRSEQLTVSAHLANAKYERSKRSRRANFYRANLESVNRELAIVQDMIALLGGN